MLQKTAVENISTAILSAAGGIPAAPPETSGTFKSIFARPLYHTPAMDGTLSDPCWQQAESFDDFSYFLKGSGSPASTQVKVFRNGGDLYLGITCYEPDGIRKSNTGDGLAVWQDDLLEIFFATRTPELWSVQFAVAAGGGRFSNIGLNNWEAAVSAEEDHWTAEIKIPIRMLHFSSGGVSFNICRQRLNTGEYLTWSPVQASFHELEAYGELLLFDYSETLAMRYGCASGSTLTRQEYEKAAAERAVPPQKLEHGPWLSYPTENSIVISWQTAGLTAGAAEYRKKGTMEWQTVLADVKYGVVDFACFHHVDLTGLEAGTEYEYRAAGIVAGGGIYYSEINSFSTLDKNRKEFSFALFADIHDQSRTVESLWKNSGDRKGDFCVNLGDMSSAMNGENIIYHGFLDKQIELFAKNIPIVWGRGNHELRGEGSRMYSQYMHNPSGRAYYDFQHGNTLFIVLDGLTDIGPGDPYVSLDHEHYLADEKKWLEELVQTPRYKNAAKRIVFAHFPPWDSDTHAARAIARLIRGTLDSTDADKKTDLFISGHTHIYTRIMPDGEIITNGEIFKSGGGIIPMPFPVVINDGPAGAREGSIIWVTCRDDSITLEAIDAAGHIIDTFSV